ncbi:MAG: gamma-glutamyltransferase [Deltaproteobacteria bacterium]|nr:gamma-glutamyltransferase [Deltaproteobacteria bacterium]
MARRRYGKTRGIVAAGHAKTAAAGCHALREGGNAFDAAVAAAFMSFVAEPSLTTICGAGFMMTHEGRTRRARLFDFFAEMPGRNRRRIRTSDLDFKAVHLDFGGTLQEFFIGRGAAATPGNVHGLLTVHKRLGRLPLRVLLEPAMVAAREGVPITEKQATVLNVVKGTVMATAGTRALYAPQGHLLRRGELFCNPALADTLDQLAREGRPLFYRGAIAAQIAREIGDRGGLITRRDLAAYRTIVRTPLLTHFRGKTLLTNPPPSHGGQLIAFSLQLLESVSWPKTLSPRDPCFYRTLVEIMWLTNHARTHVRRFPPTVVRRYQKWLQARLHGVTPLPSEAVPDAHRAPGNTTHLSVLDDERNAAAVTTSHGEGNGICIPGTGIVLNNLLGEEDINPNGFHQWPPGTRLPSMMAPTLILHRGRPVLVLGSAGSNRLRTAIFQTIARLFDLHLPIARAVNDPRIHWERGQLDLEPGLPVPVRRILTRLEPHVVQWKAQNIFFGGLHAVMCHPDGTFGGAGDRRRGGTVRSVD